MATQPPDHTGRPSPAGPPWLYSFFNRALDGMLLADDHGRYIDVNPAACEMLGYPREELLRLSITDLVDMEQAQAREMFSTFLQQGEMSGELPLRRKDGSTLIAEYRAVAHEALGVHLSIIRDVTRLREVEQARQDFQAMVTHELRSPLVAIKSATALAKDDLQEGNPDQVLEMLDTVAQQTDRLLGLVNNLLDVSQMEAGAFSVHPEPGDLREAVDEAVATIAQVTPMPVRVEIPKDMPPVYMDRGAVAQVLDNLLSNAAKFAQPDAGMRITAIRKDDDVLVSVMNRGEPIPPEKMADLFQKFSQLHFKERRPGIGLGLAICRGIVEAHGGQIWAESSQERRETTFTFTLPLAEEQ